jgi:hypothetical protein
VNCRFDIRLLQVSDLSVYDEFLIANAQLPIYGAASFLKFLEMVTDCRAYVFLALAGSRIVGALPYAVVHREGIGRVVNSLPWYGSHGSIVLDRNVVDDDADAIRRSLLTHFVAAISGDDLLSTTLILLPKEEPYKETYKAILRPTQVETRIGQITDLPCDGENRAQMLEAVLKQKTRNLVRKSLRQDFVELVTDEEWAWDFLAKTHYENITAIGGLAKPVEHFRAMRLALPPAMRRLSVALNDGTPSAAMLLFTFGDSREYITPAISKEFRQRQPLSFLIWMGMLDAIQSGCRRWNWGGTWVSQDSLHHFKEGFGASDHPYSYLITATDRGLTRLRELKSQLATLFPYTYVYPYSAL